MSEPTVPPPQIALPQNVERALLIHPPVFDTRFPWAEWQQPSLLLRLSTHLRQSNTEVRLIDFLHNISGKRLKRKRVGTLDMGGEEIYKWRFGLPKSSFYRQLVELARSGWNPDHVFVECGATFWWEGVQEAVQQIRKKWTQARIILIGSYARLATQHATDNIGADEVVSSEWPELGDLAPDLSLYSNSAVNSLVLLGSGRRDAKSIVDEISEAAKKGVRQFAFAEHKIALKHPQLYRAVLEEIVVRKMKIKLFALGNVAPAEIAEQPELTDLMKRAGYEQICLADDRDIALDTMAAEEMLENCRRAAEVYQRVGFRARTEALIGSVSIGHPGEDLAARARIATLVAHHVGSVILWPYQPKPQECPDLPLEDQNGKLFPFRHLNGYSYRDYTYMLGLTAVLNSKYHTRTFDFMGDGLIAKLFRNGIMRKGWEPDPEVKGSLQLPMRISR